MCISVKFMFKKVTQFFTFLLLLCYTKANCQLLNKNDTTREHMFGGVSVFFDEDFFLGMTPFTTNLDRDYTGGGALQLSGKFIEKSNINILNVLLDKFTRLDKIHHKNSINRFNSLKFGLTTFTPRGIFLNKTYPIQNDRPYANIAFISTSRTSADLFEESAITTELELGMLGTSLGEATQAGIHSLYRKKHNLCDTCRPYAPKGWGNQISNGGEFTGEYSVTYKKLINLNFISTANENGPSKYPLKYFDAFYTGSAYLGHYTAMEGTLTARAGIIRSRWWVFNSYPLGANAEAKIGADSTRGKHFRNWEFYLFGTFRPKEIGRAHV